MTGETRKEKWERIRKEKWKKFWESIATLEANEIPFRIISKNGHVKVARRIDFWPTTGIWMSKTARSKGIESLIKHHRENYYHD